jgi:alkaline phosphatase D
MGAAVAWGKSSDAAHGPWKERRELFPEGVASGDPDHHSVILWTRVGDPRIEKLFVEVAEDREFTRIVASAAARVSAEADGTCRVLTGGLHPARVYWFRFIAPDGSGSRTGRTITAPAPDDSRPVRFAFASCQNTNQGAQNAYRRMIYEDERAAEADQIHFVMHLGDFIYEIVLYPEDRREIYDRRVRDVVRYPHGEKIRELHIPTTLEDYRAVYKAYLHDPDLQDARARWPFVPMWDNHEFSWLGWQSLQQFYGETRFAQNLKVAANQAFFEFQPARLSRPRSKSLDAFHPPQVKSAPITRFDRQGLGDEPNNRIAIDSLRGYRALRWGRNVELIITDQRSYRSQDPASLSEAASFSSADFPGMIPQEAMENLDAGRAITGIKEVRPPQTILGAKQKAWFLERLRKSQAPWKLWGNTVATLEMRADPQNLPPGLGPAWGSAGYAISPQSDFSTAFVERGEIYDFIEERAITGFVTLSGDRHAFWAGLAAKALPPKTFKPVGVAFVTGSISAPGLLEAYEHTIPRENPLRALYAPGFNLLLKHGVKSCLEYARSGDLAKARAVSNRELAPHVSFVDMGGHGYSIVKADPHLLETEFVCIPRPLERSDRADGGPLRYRVKVRTPLWRKDEHPAPELDVVEGDAALSL